MRLVLEFEIEEKWIDIEYRKIFMHFLKKCISISNDAKYYDNYYKDNVQKNFSFSVFFDEPKFLSNKIELASNKIKMIFSTSEELTGYIFYSSFLENKRKKILLKDDNFMVLKSIMKIAEPKVNNNKALVKMNSPLVIRKHSKESNKDFYYSCVHEQFIEEAEKVIKNQLEKEGYPTTYIETFHIKLLKCKKVIVTHYGCKIEATIGNFLIEGDSNILTYLVRAGIGSRKSECFGQMELLTDDI